jgi:hypothetical protein
METKQEQSQLQKSRKHETTTIRNARYKNKGTIMLWLIHKNGGCHVRFQSQVTLQNRKCHNSIKILPCKRLFFPEIKNKNGWFFLAKLSTFGLTDMRHIPLEES